MKDNFKKIFEKIISKIKKNFKVIIGLIALLIVVGVVLFILNYVNESKRFMTFIDKVSNDVVGKLEYSTIVGNAKLKVDSGCSIADNLIIDAKDYVVDYQVNLSDRYANIDLVGEYEDGKINGNAYISNGNVYLLLDGIYDKYLNEEFEYLKILQHPNEYRQIIMAINGALGEILKHEYYNYDTVKLNGEKVNKVTLDLTGKNYKLIKSKLINNLKANKSFMANLVNIINKDDKELVDWLNKIDMSDYKFSLYTTRYSNDFVKFEMDSKELDINVEYKDGKYSFEYYIRGGLRYFGHIEMKGNNVSRIYVVNNYYHVYVDVSVLENNIKYNEEVNSYKNINSEDVVKYNELAEDAKDEIRKNSIINKIYDNYLARYDVEPIIEEAYDRPDMHDPTAASDYIE